MPKFQDLSGKKFGNLTAIQRVENKGKNVMWLCKCECGTETTVSTTHLKSGHTSSCGCLRNKPPKNIIDLTGQKFGRLIVIRKERPHITNGGASVSMWRCECDCGKIISVSSQALRNGNTKSCGCYRDEKVKDLNFEDLTGKKFERLTVIKYLGKEERVTRGYNWLCECECGNTIKANASKLKSGWTKSCGCLRKEVSGNKNRKYQNVSKRLYSVYKGILSRCYDEKQREYCNYGGRGISVCAEWLGEHGFDKFSEWAYLVGYDENADRGEYTIERKYVNGNYCPNNCVWKTNKEQQNNRRNCVFLEHGGKRQTIAQWAEELNIPYDKAYWHLRRKNRTVQELIDKNLG